MFSTNELLLKNWLWVLEYLLILGFFLFQTKDFFQDFPCLSFHESSGIWATKKLLYVVSVTSLSCLGLIVFSYTLLFLFFSRFSFSFFSFYFSCVFWEAKQLLLYVFFVISLSCLDLIVFSYALFLVSFFSRFSSFFFMGFLGKQTASVVCFLRDISVLFRFDCCLCMSPRKKYAWDCWLPCFLKWRNGILSWVISHCNCVLVIHHFANFGYYRSTRL